MKAKKIIGLLIMLLSFYDFSESQISKLKSYLKEAD